MQQHKEFIIAYNPERIDGLTRALVDLLPSLGLTLINQGGTRSCTRPIDFASIDVLVGDAIVGNYAYELAVDRYKGTLDLPGIEAKKYQIIMTSLAQRFPELR